LVARLAIFQALPLFCHPVGPFCHPERSEAQSRDLLCAEAKSFAGSRETTKSKISRAKMYFASA